MPKELVCKWYDYLVEVKDVKAMTQATQTSMQAQLLAKQRQAALEA